MIYAVVNNNWDRSGNWMPEIDNIFPYGRGYHVNNGTEQLVYRLGPEVWTVECRGTIINDFNTMVTSEVRLVNRIDAWNDDIARQFAIDCASRVMHIYERRHGSEIRSAIVAAKAFLRDEITVYELEHANYKALCATVALTEQDGFPDGVSDAAWAAVLASAVTNPSTAAGTCAWYAALAVARDACQYVVNEMGHLVWNAANFAVWDPVWHAAKNNELKWQAERLRGILHD